MVSKDVRRGFLTLSIVMLCLAPAVAQAGICTGRAMPRAAAPAWQQGVLETLWRGLAHLFEKEGASIDPYGKPGPSAGTSSSGTSDGGAGIDPSGVPSHG